MSEALGQRARAATRTSSVPLQLLALLALYAIFYQLGRASGPLSWQQRCTCPEAARTLSIREGLSPDEVKGIADCVLHDQPTRGRLHGRLARCIGRSAWQIPGRPSSSGGGGSISSSSSSWEDVNSATAEDAFDDSSSSSSDGDGLGGSSSADSAAVDADEGEDDEDEGDDEDEELAGAVPSTSSGGASSDESVSAEERAARMMAAIREHDDSEALEASDAASSSSSSSGSSSSSSSSSDSSASPPPPSPPPPPPPTPPPPPPADASGPRVQQAKRAALKARKASNTSQADYEKRAAEIATQKSARIEKQLRQQKEALAAAAAAAAAPAPVAAAASSSSTGGPPKRVITYSLYGKTPKYVKGAVRNAELISSIFPGWTARFYIDMSTVPEEIVTQLKAANAELVPIDMSKHGTQSMFWRFWAAADPTVERFISRDVDSRLMPRDKAAVDLWIASGKGFHVIRDHPSHSLYPMSGGLWGCTKGSLSNVMELIASFPTDSNYLTDMNFLNKLVWPIAMKDVLQHDAFTCVEFDQPPCQAMPYPVSVDRPAGNHVGQVFDAEGNARSNDVQALLTARQPDACKPGGDPVAARKEQGMRVPPLPRERECRSMRTQHKVVVGVTWGTLPADLQMRWQRIACDAL